jgi:hypothetical protein
VEVRGFDGGMKRCLIVTALLVFGGATSTAQDFRKVVEIVDEMETSLRKTMVKEETERKADIAGLRVELDRLRAVRRVAVAADSTRSAGGTETALDDIRLRLDLLEKRADGLHTDLGELTKAMSLLVTELKASVRERMVSPPHQY